MMIPAARDTARHGDGHGMTFIWPGILTTWHKRKYNAIVRQLTDIMIVHTIIEKHNLKLELEHVHTCQWY